MISTPKAHPITSKGHHHDWCPNSSFERRWHKRQARRAQRRANHKEVEEQWQADWPNSMKNEMYAMPRIRALMEKLEPPMNMFSPLPPWMITEWEKAGIEFWNNLKSISALTNKRGGPFAWRRNQHLQAQARALSRCDETLLADLQRSLK